MIPANANVGVPTYAECDAAYAQDPGNTSSTCLDWLGENLAGAAAQGVNVPPGANLTYANCLARYGQDVYNQNGQAVTICNNELTLKPGPTNTSGNISPAVPVQPRDSNTTLINCVEAHGLHLYNDIRNTQIYKDCLIQALGPRALDFLAPQADHHNGSRTSTTTTTTHKHVPRDNYSVGYQNGCYDAKHGIGNGASSGSHSTFYDDGYINGYDDGKGGYC